MRVVSALILGLTVTTGTAFAQESREQIDNPFANPLKSSGQSAACSEGPVSAFGRYIGEWNFQDSQISADGQSWTEGAGGQWDFYCLGEGIAIQDFWQPKAGGFGTTLRMYNPKSDSWDVVFTGEGSQAMSRLTATQNADGSVEMHYVTPEFSPARRITFSTPDEEGFDWELSISSDNKQTWTTVYKMKVTPR
ncbi:MAG: hypothetical protein AAGH53_12550 [Pseudomonadota bacterium]